MTSSVSNKTLSSIRTTPNQIKTTTTQKGVIIDDGDSSKGDKDPGYNVLTTPAIYPISPAEQGNKLFLNQNSCFRATCLSLKPLYFGTNIMSYLHQQKQMYTVVQISETNTIFFNHRQIPEQSSCIFGRANTYVSDKEKFTHPSILIPID